MPDPIPRKAQVKIAGILPPLDPASQQTTACLDQSPGCAKEIPPIILGKDLANNLGATVGSIVMVTSPQGELTPFGVVPRFVRFKVGDMSASEETAAE